MSNQNSDHSKNKRLTLLVMAAGLGSRYGGIKQIDGFGPNGETIMDYSLYDALACGFSKIVFVVRQEILETVQEMFLPKLEGRAEVHFVVQGIHNFVPGKYISQTKDRKKPWGTTHAMLCGKEFIHEPFAAINADDFYGRTAFRSLASFLSELVDDQHAMVGYTLSDVLTENGSVSRGIASVDACQQLLSLSEMTKIVSRDGLIMNTEEGNQSVLDPRTLVSMNCWGFQPEVFDLAEHLFHEFLDNAANPSSEFYIALLVTALIERKLGKVRVIGGGEKWFGVTYIEDKPSAVENIRQLVKMGEYPLDLWKSVNIRTLA
jgi:NDP-sugar pyrophosphorylase family protein